MKPSIFARFQNAGDCPIERVTVICRYAATTNSEEYVDDGSHARYPPNTNAEIQEQVVERT